MFKYIIALLLYIPLTAYSCEEKLNGEYIEINPEGSPAKFVFNSEGGGQFSYQTEDGLYAENIQWKRIEPSSFEITYFDDQGSANSVEQAKCLNDQLVFIVDEITYKYRQIK